MKTIINTLIITSCALMFVSQISAQRILLDKPVRAGQLTLFPEVDDEDTYYYLPDKPQLAKNDQGEPSFSFTRYVKNVLSDGSSAESILESGTGGGIVHCLVELSVSDEMIKEAEQSLRRVNGSGKIVGPVIFKSGTVALISAVAQEGGKMTETVVGLGSAPVLENQKSAVAVQLNQMGSKLLWETFNTSTPDFSFNFEMQVEGYMSPKQVKIEADFDRIYKHKSFEVGTKVQGGPVVLAAEIKKSFDELFDSGAIKLTQIGEDEELDKLKDVAYTQLTNLMFNKVGGQGIAELSKIGDNGRGGMKKSMLDRASENLTQARQEAKQDNIRIEQQQEQIRQRAAQVREMIQKNMAASNTGGAAGTGRIPPPPNQQRPAMPAPGSPEMEKMPKKVPIPSMSVAASYKQKTVKRSGRYVIDLNKFTQEVRSMPFAYNPGNVKSQCETCFHEVNLDDPLMQQREINASLGGINSEDFDFINFINIIMKKKHQNGDETVKELKIDKSKFNADANLFRTVYGFKGDKNRDKWLSYDYRTQWSYKGGYVEETDWETTEFGSIALSPSVIKKPVYIEVDEDFVFDEDLRGVELKFYTTLGESEDVTSVNLKTKNGEELSHTVELLLPADKEDFEYDVTYFVRGKDPQSSARKATNYGRVDVDRFMP